TLKELSALAGLTTGLGLNLWGQELAYAWVPYGDLGSTHYISLVIRLGETERSKHNLIQYPPRSPHQVKGEDPDAEQMLMLLNTSDPTRTGQKAGPNAHPE